VRADLNAQVIDEVATTKRQEEADKAVKEGEDKPKVRSYILCHHSLM
jgi:hypothetical protein